MNLRQRIRQDKICCQPWNKYKGEIREFCISAKCLFSNKGIPYDILEIELKEDGWLFEDEMLMDVLRRDKNLKRKHLSNFCTEDDTFGNIPDNFTEEDYINYF